MRCAAPPPRLQAPDGGSPPDRKTSRLTASVGPTSTVSADPERQARQFLMPGRKKGRQRGASGSKALSARKWNETIRDAREDLSRDRKERLRRGGDAAPPRLSASGFRSLASLLRQRLRADEAQIGAPTPPVVRQEVSATRTKAAPQSDFFSSDWTNSRPRRVRNLVSLCINQIGIDFLAYRADDDAIAQAFVLLPPLCLSRLSRSASARGNIANHNIALLCSPGVSTLWLRGRFTDEGADALLPELRTSNTLTGGICTPQGATDLPGAYRDSNIGVDRHGKDERTSREVLTPTVAHGARTGSSGSSAAQEEEDEGDRGWETACDRIEASLRGGISLTSLDLSSPRITAGFVRRLAARVPSLQRLGLRGSLGVVGGPDAVCDHLPQLGALRELDLSHCRWFCDTTLRRLAKALSRGLPDTRAEGSNETDAIPTSTNVVHDGTSGWGAASGPAAHALALRGRAVSDTPGEGGRWPGVIGAGEGVGETRVHTSASRHRFRTFTVTCAHAAVTEKGARVAEAISPGLLVVLEDRPAVCCV